MSPMSPETIRQIEDLVNQGLTYLRMYWEVFVIVGIVALIIIGASKFMTNANRHS